MKTYVSRTALRLLVRTVRAIASDPQLPMRKESVMISLSIRILLAALTQLRITLAGRGQSVYERGDGDL